MLWESTGPVDNILSDAPLGGNGEFTESGVPAQCAGYSGAVLLAVRIEAFPVGLDARPPSKRFMGQRNKEFVQSNHSNEVYSGLAESSTGSESECAAAVARKKSSARFWFGGTRHYASPDA
jgi:hypothetical protein